MLVNKDFFNVDIFFICKAIQQNGLYWNKINFGAIRISFFYQNCVNNQINNSTSKSRIMFVKNPLKTMIK